MPGVKLSVLPEGVTPGGVQDQPAGPGLISGLGHPLETDPAHTGDPGPDLDPSVAPSHPPDHALEQARPALEASVQERQVVTGALYTRQQAVSLTSPCSVHRIDLCHTFAGCFSPHCLSVPRLAPGM